jgi:hypothetical protein
MKLSFWAALALVLFLSLSATAQPISIFHDPWLNWDFINNTGAVVNDFEIIVETPGWIPPEVLLGMPFPVMGTTYGDNNGDGLPDTKLTWSGADVGPGMVAHVGAYMLGSGRILDAYWTFNGAKVGPSIPITYELTEIFDPDPTVPDDNEIHMLLQMSPGYYDDPGNTLAVGWANIRTFANIPYDVLGLEDLNEGLDLSTLALYKVDAREGGPGGDLITGDPIYPGIDFPAESFFDVYFDVPVPDGNVGPAWESLLVADIVMDDGMGGLTTVGIFWNLNPQCPEPGTMVLVALGALAVLYRIRRR